MHKSLGVIGGMGPKATSVFFEKVIEHTDAQKDQDHINMVILNHSTIPDRTTAIINKQGDTFLNEIKKDFNILEHAEVSNIAIPCNTSHYYYDDMQSMTHIPIIHMVKETVEKIYQTKGRGAKVGIFATTGTIQSGVYEKWCAEYGVKLYKPDAILQSQVMEIIYENVKSGLSEDAEPLENLIRTFIKNEKCDLIILACTELSCIKLNEEAKQYIIDAMDVLVEKSITLSGKKLKHKHENISI